MKTYLISFIQHHATCTCCFAAKNKVDALDTLYMRYPACSVVNSIEEIAI